MLRSHIIGIWDRLNRQSIRVSRRDEPGETGRLEPVVKYMKENFAYEITLSELAEMLPMSEGQFCRIFKQTMKMSPMQYLMRYRILQSCRLLQDTDKKILIRCFCRPLDVRRENTGVQEIIRRKAVI